MDLLLILTNRQERSEEMKQNFAIIGLDVLAAAYAKLCGSWSRVH